MKLISDARLAAFQQFGTDTGSNTKIERAHLVIGQIVHAHWTHLRKPYDALALVLRLNNKSATVSLLETPLNPGRFSVGSWLNIKIGEGSSAKNGACYPTRSQIIQLFGTDDVHNIVTGNCPTPNKGVMYSVGYIGKQGLTINYYAPQPKLHVPDVPLAPV